MTASDYPISFPYGATSAPYSPGRPHKGDDRAAPCGTPVVIGGTQIGLVGTTGLSTGCHLHIQEWKDNFANTRKPKNSFKGGVVTQATSASEFGNYVTIQNKDGWNDTYAHLSKINVKIGDRIEEMKTSKTTAIWLVRTLTHKHNPPEEVWKNWEGLDDKQLTARLKNVYESAWFKKQTAQIKGTSDSKIKALKDKIINYVRSA